MIIRFLGRFLLWFYALLVLAALVFFGIGTLFGGNRKNQKINLVAKPDFEELTLEPLYFAFSNEERFDSSLNGVVNSDAIGKWNNEVREQWIMVLIFVGSAVVLSLCSALLPDSRLKSIFRHEVEPESTEVTELVSDETVQNVFEYIDYEMNTIE